MTDQLEKCYDITALCVSQMQLIKTKVCYYGKLKLLESLQGFSREQGGNFLRLFTEVSLTTLHYC